MKNLTDQNEGYVERIGQMRDELEVLDLYVQLYEDGLDIHELVKRHYAAKDEVKIVQTESKDKTKMYEK